MKLDGVSLSLAFYITKLQITIALTVYNFSPQNQKHTRSDFLEESSCSNYLRRTDRKDCERVGDGLTADVVQWTGSTCVASSMRHGRADWLGQVQT